MKTIRVITNSDWFESKIYDGNYMQFEIVKCCSLVKYFFTALHYLKYNIAIINIGSTELLILCLAKWLFPNSRLKIISIDLILSKPVDIKSYIISKLKAVLLKKVDYFILFMKETSGYEKHYYIQKNKLVYIPFKINSYEYVANKKTTDCGYIFSGGVSKRDYNTFFKSVRDLDYKIKLLASDNSISSLHGTSISYDLPQNVSIIHDDGSSESWVDHIAQAKFVVLPILASTISPTGISTYLLAMALGKCVIISDGPATQNIIPAEAAIIVPPEDVEQLKQAIIKTYEDDALREKVALNGYNFALTFGDHNRLVADIIKFINSLKYI